MDPTDLPADSNLAINEKDITQLKFTSHPSITSPIYYEKLLTQTLGKSVKSLPSFVHETTGAGAPEMGTSILIGSPARTRISLPPRPDKSTFGASVDEVNTQKTIDGIQNKKYLKTNTVGYPVFNRLQLVNIYSYRNAKETVKPPGTVRLTSINASQTTWNSPSNFNVLHVSMAIHRAASNSLFNC